MSRSEENLRFLEDTLCEHKELLRAHTVLLAQAYRAKANEPGRYQDYVNGLIDALSDLIHIGSKIAEEVVRATPTETHRHPDTGEVLAVL